MEIEILSLTGKDDSFKIVSTEDNLNISETAYSTNQKSCMINIDDAVDFQHNKDTFESDSFAALESKNDVISEAQCSQANETVQGSGLIPQVEKKKRANRAIKKNEKMFTRDTERGASDTYALRTPDSDRSKMI